MYEECQREHVRFRVVVGLVTRVTIPPEFSRNLKRIVGASCVAELVCGAGTLHSATARVARQSQCVTQVAARPDSDSYWRTVHAFEEYPCARSTSLSYIICLVGTLMANGVVPFVPAVLPSTYLK